MWFKRKTPIQKETYTQDEIIPLLNSTYEAGYNEGYAQGVQATKNKLREIARRVNNG